MAALFKVSGMSSGDGGTVVFLKKSRKSAVHFFGHFLTFFCQFWPTLTVVSTIAFFGGNGSGTGYH